MRLFNNPFDTENTSARVLFSLNYSATACITVCYSPSLVRSERKSKPFRIHLSCSEGITSDRYLSQIFSSVAHIWCRREKNLQQRRWRLQRILCSGQPPRPQFERARSYWLLESLQKFTQELCVTDGLPIVKVSFFFLFFLLPSPSAGIIRRSIKFPGLLTSLFLRKRNLSLRSKLNIHRVSHDIITLAVGENTFKKIFIISMYIFLSISS